MVVCDIQGIDPMKTGSLGVLLLPFHRETQVAAQGSWRETG